MKNEFKKILHFLTQLNQNDPQELVSSADLKKEYRRIEDLNSLDQQSIDNLDLCKKKYGSSIDDIMKQICDLDVCLGVYVWHVESMQDIVKKFITKDVDHD